MSPRNLMGDYFTICGPRRPWLWIIEYLSRSPQIDISIIHALIEESKISPDDLGKNTTERVALRCLEEIFHSKKDFGSVAPPPDSRVSIDLSSSCKDVLEQIAQQVGLSNLKKDGPELLKWDVEPFIKHKRSTLPKPVLEQLKESMLKMQLPVLEQDEFEPTSGPEDSDDENGNDSLYSH